MKDTYNNFNGKDENSQKIKEIGVDERPSYCRWLMQVMWTTIQKQNDKT